MRRQRPIVEALEQRLLYSAEVGPALASALTGPAAVEQRIIEPHLELAAQNEQASQSAPKEVVFVDARTPDYEQLVADIAAQSDRHIDVVMLDASRDGLQQISEALAGRDDVAALHIIAHGDTGVVQLGNSLVTAGALERNPGLVEGWSKALTADADILLYGCDVAATAQGKLLADTLARLTGADVSASDDATGHASLGGDWKLEYATGAIEAQVALSQSAQDAWANLLGNVTLVAYEPPFANMTDFAYEIAGGGSHSQSFTYTSGAGTYVASQIDFVLYKNAAASGGNVNVQLRDGLGGGSTLLASGSVSRTGLGQSEGWVSVSLTTSATLVDGTTYYIVIKGTGSGNIFVGIDDTAASYADGTYFDSSDTAQPAKDMAFRVIFSDAPVVDLNGPGTAPATIGQDETAAFTEQTPVLIAPSGTLTDPDSANLASLTATLTARPDGDAVESLSLNAAATTAASGAGLTVTYTASTGVLQITGSASVATYQTILQGIQYNNTTDAPTITDRSVMVAASDGGAQGVARVSMISITAVNDAPSVDLNAGAAGQDVTVAFTEQTPALIAPSGTLVEDSGTLASLTATLTARPDGNAVESLSLNAAATTAASGAGLTVSYTAATGVLSITGSASVATYQTILQGILYSNTSDTPTTTSRSVTVVANDGALASATQTSTVTVAAVNDAPVADLNAGGAGQDVTVAFTEQTPVLIAPSGTLADVDSANLASLTVTLTTRPDGNAVESLSLNAAATTAASGAGLTVSYTAATGVLSISGSASLATYQTILQGILYGNTSDAPTTTSRSVTVAVNDGTTSSAAATSTVTVAAVNDAPVVDLNAGGAGQDVTVAFTEQTPVLIAPAGTLVDVDSANLASLTVTLTTRPDGNAVESLSLNASASTAASGAGLTVSYTAATGVLSISGSASLATYQTILQGIQYGNTSDTPTTTSRSVTVAVNDGALASATQTSTVTVAAVNDAPVADLNAGGAGQDVTVAFTEQTPVLIAPSGTLADVDSANLASLTVTLTARPDGNAVESLSLNAAATTAASGAGLTVSYTAATGVLSISGSASVATYQTILQGILYGNTSDTPTTTSRSVTVAANDGALASATQTSTVTVAAVNDAPVADLNAGGAGQDVTVAFTEQTPVLIAPSGTLADVDSANLASLTVTLTARPDGNAVESLSLNAAATTAASGAGLTVSYTAATGVLSITGSASLATYQTILQGILYDNTSDTPTTTSRSVTVAVNDGALASATQTSTVTVAAVNDAPAVDLNAGGAGQDVTVAFTEQTPVLIAPAGTLVDADSANLASLTVTLTARPDGDAVESLSLNASATSAASGAGLTVSYTAATGVLSISGSASLATYQTILQGILYGNTSDTPTTTDRSVAVVANDGALASATQTSTVTVAAVNDAPVADLNAGGAGQDVTVAFTEQTPVLIAPAGTLADVDSANLASLTVTLTARPDGNAVESLSLNASATTAASGAGLTVSYTAATGVLSISGSASLATYQTILQGIQYGNTSDTPTTTSRSVTVAVNDGTTSSAAATSTVTVAAVNDAPAVDLNAGAAGQDVTVAFTEQTPALIAPSGTLADVDSASLASLTVTLTARPDGNAVESLSLNAAATTAASGAGLTVSYTAATGVLSITGSASVATYQTILQGILYSNTSDTPTTTDRLVTMLVNDGALASATQTSTVTVSAANDAPVADLNAGGAGQDVTVAFTEQTPVLIAPAGTLVDADSANLASLTVTLTARPDGDAVESLSLNASATAAASGAGLTVSYTAATGVLSISGSASVATYQTILQGILYGNTSDAPTTTDRLVTVLANDGALASAAQTSTVTVAAVNDAPAVDLNAGGAGQDVTVAFTEQTPVLIAPSGTLADVDSATLASLTVTLAARPDGDAVESLSLNASATAAAAGLTVSYTAATGVLSITGSASVATYQTILQGIQYGNTSDTPTTASRSVTVAVNDGALASATQTSTVTVAAVNDAPAVDLNAGGAGQDVTVAFTEQTPVLIAPAGTLVDADSANLAALTVTLTARPDGDAVESLSLDASATAAAAGLTVSYSAATGVLSITGSASLATYQTILQGIQYNNTSDTPTTTDRLVTVLANDGALASAAATSTATVTAVNDAPVVTLSGGVSAYTAGGAAVLGDGALTIADPDTATLASASISIGAGLQAAEDVLGFSNDPATMGNIAGSYNAATGVLSLSSAGGAATLAQWQAALNSVTYGNTNPLTSGGARTLSFQLSDGAASSLVAARNLSVSAAPPLLGLVLPLLPGSALPSIGGGSLLPGAAPPVTPQQAQQAQPAPAPAVARAAAAPAAEGADIQILAVGAERVTIQVAGGLRLIADTAATPGLRFSAPGLAQAALGPVNAADLLADLIGQIEVRTPDILQVNEPGSSIRVDSFAGDLARLRDGLREQDDIQTRTIVTLATGSLSMTLAYLLWLVRGGALAASMLSAMPAWRLLDPLPILARVDGEDDEDESADDDHAIASFYGEPEGTEPA